MVGIKTASFHLVNADLVSKGRVGEHKLDFLHPKIGVFVMDVGHKMGNFNVQLDNFFLGMFKLESLVDCKASCRCRLGFPSNVLAGIMEEAKIQQEGVFDILIPVEYLPRRH